MQIQKKRALKFRLRNVRLRHYSVLMGRMIVLLVGTMVATLATTVTSAAAHDSHTSNYQHTSDYRSQGEANQTVIIIVHSCGPPDSRYMDLEYLEEQVVGLQTVTSFFERQSNGKFTIDFRVGNAYSPDRDSDGNYIIWSQQSISKFWLESDPCRLAVSSDHANDPVDPEDHTYVLILADVYTGPRALGFASLFSGPAVVAVEERRRIHATGRGGQYHYDGIYYDQVYTGTLYTQRDIFLTTVAHEIGHMIFGWSHPDELLEHEGVAPKPDSLAALMSTLSKRSDLRRGVLDTRKAYVSCYYREREGWLEVGDTCVDDVEESSSASKQSPRDPTSLQTAKAITTGGSHTCAIRTNDTITCWGANHEGQSNTPTGTYKAITAGLHHTCAIRTNDTITCWGNDSFGGATAPTGTYKAITAGLHHTCAIRTNDTITCWGNDRFGEATAPTGTYKAITAGVYHTCAIRTNDTITCWGYNKSSQATAPTGTYKVITSGGRHTCAIRTNDTITCWGNDSLGEATAPTGTYKAITAGLHHTCAIRTNDTITCWGNDSFGEATAPTGTYKAITAGLHHTCAIRTNDTITCWGND